LHGKTLVSNAGINSCNILHITIPTAIGNTYNFTGGAGKISLIKPAICTCTTIVEEHLDATHAIFALVIASLDGITVGQSFTVAGNASGSCPSTIFVI
jgi:hypothetical protein